MRRTSAVHGFVLAASALLPWGCTELLLGDDVYVDEKATSTGGPTASTGGSGGDSASANGSGAGGQPVCEKGLTACGTSCALLESDPLHCGECGRSCLGSDCHGGLCEPAEIGSELASPRKLALDATHVYWTCATGAVQRAPKSGGAVETIAGGQSSPGTIHVDATHVFWADEASSTLMRIPKVGTQSPELLVKVDGLSGFTLDSDHAYLARNQQNGDVGKVVKSGGGLAPLAAGQMQVGDLAIVDDRVLWAGYIDPAGVTGGGPNPGDAVSGGYVRAVPRAGGDVVTLAAGEGNIVGLAVSGSTVVWADATNQLIRVRAAADDEASTLVWAQDVRGLSADGASVVWTTSGGTVRARPIGDGQVRVLAVDIANVGAVAVDETHVYFVREGAGGAVLRVAK